MAEHQIVDLAVEGSNPSSHPNSLLLNFLRNRPPAAVVAPVRSRRPGELRSAPPEHKAARHRCIACVRNISDCLAIWICRRFQLASSSKHRVGSRVLLVVWPAESTQTLVPEPLANDVARPIGRGAG